LGEEVTHLKPKCFGVPPKKAQGALTLVADKTSRWKKTGGGKEENGLSWRGRVTNCGRLWGKIITALTGPNKVMGMTMASIFTLLGGGDVQKSMRGGKVDKEKELERNHKRVSKTTAEVKI